jgi:hypothetical protein
MGSIVGGWECSLTVAADLSRLAACATSILIPKQMPAT